MINTDEMTLAKILSIVRLAYSTGLVDSEGNRTSIANKLDGDQKAFAKLPIKDAGFTVRTRNVLLAENIYTVNDLLPYKPGAILCFANAGRKMINEIQEVLAEYGLKLGM